MKKEILQTFNKLGYDSFLPIQEKAIPAILENKNLFIQAKTGSGKTLAYLLPALDIANHESQYTEVLIVAPTRELALQISEVAQQFANITKHHIITCIGGIDIHKQEMALKHRPTIVIGTPGRLKDLYTQNKLDITHLKLIILDEVDLIVSTGQRKETECLIQQTDAQIVCTSATKTDLLTSFLPTNYEEIIADTTKLNENIQSYYITCTDRKHTLLRLLHKLPIQQCIVFTNYKNDANVLSTWLQKRNILCSAFSSFYEEKERIQILDAFKRGNIRVLIATDAAARGLDLYDVSHIIHYDIPLDIETFIHRSGRSGHQNNTGTTITLIKEINSPIAQYIMQHAKPYETLTNHNTDLSIALKKDNNEVILSTTIQIQAGKKDKLRPKDIIGALCTKLDFSNIGTLEIQDTYSTVVILNTDANLLDTLQNLSIKGKRRKIIKR